jgi:hypothetical protein
MAIYHSSFMVYWWVPGSLWPTTSTVEKKVPMRLPMPDTIGQISHDGEEDHDNDDVK